MPSGSVPASIQIQQPVNVDLILKHADEDKDDCDKEATSDGRHGQLGQGYVLQESEQS